MSGRAAEPPLTAGRRALLLLSGVAIAAVAAMCGIGGGLFAVPLLHFGFGFELRRAVATGLGLVVATAVFSTLAEVVRDDSALRLELVAALIPGAWVGARLGYAAATRLSGRALRGVFVVALAVAAARVLGASGAADAASPAVPLDWTDYLGALVIGCGGGFCAPLLGIGGGLVFVPALFLAVPELGFAGARACSLATSIAASSRSLRLYLASGEVARAHALTLGVGAAFGAALGVWTIHLPGAARYGRLGLGLVLVFVALRFLRDVLRPADSEPRRP